MNMVNVIEHFEAKKAEIEARLKRIREGGFTFRQKGPNDIDWQDVTQDRISEMEEWISSYQKAIDGLRKAGISD